MIYAHAGMAMTKVAVTLDSRTLRRVDRLVQDARYSNRSQAIEARTSRLDFRNEQSG
jgi:metal-responsive CopG/Arc/MetJ family transcriptional regulator